MIREAVDNALLPVSAADVDDDEGGDGVVLMELLASTSDMVLSNEYRYIFIWHNKTLQHAVTRKCDKNTSPKTSFNVVV